MTLFQKFSWAVAALHGTFAIWWSFAALNGNDAMVGWVMYALLATYMSVSSAMYPVRSTPARELYSWRLTVNGVVVAHGNARTAEEASRDLETAQQEHRP